MDRNDAPLCKKVCQDCINDIAERRYGGCFAWNACDDVSWSEGRVECPGDHSVGVDGEGDGHYPIDKVPNHCPHAERHAQAAAQPEWCIVRGDKFGPCKNQFCRESEGEWSTCEYDSRPFKDQDNRTLQNRKKEKMKK